LVLFKNGTKISIYIKTKLMRLLKWIKHLFKKKQTQLPQIKFGWVKDSYDPRDIKFRVTMPHELPSLVDLRAQCPPIYNQAEIGSCTANALGAAYQFEQMKQKRPNFLPSRLFIYYNERAMEGTINEDAGAMIRDGIKTMVSEGVCPESMWEYNTWRFKERPPHNCYVSALDNQIQEYLRLSPHSLYEVKHCLSEGYPVVFGFTIFSSFMSPEVASTGIAKMPQPNDQLIGGHAVMAVGYDDSKQALIVRNSWGEVWGMNGYFYLPYGYVEVPNLSADYWTIRLVE